MRYIVTGRQPVLGVGPGGTLDLDPREPHTARLLARGSVELADEPAAPVVVDVDDDQTETQED